MQILRSFLYLLIGASCVYISPATKRHRKRKTYLNILRSGGTSELREWPQLDEFVARVMERYKSPGVSLALIKNRKLQYTRGYGYANKEERLVASKDTKFCIGSVTKSYTSTLLAILLSSTDRITWDTPIVDILGEKFKLKDEFRTNKTTLRDVLAHKTGIARYDMIWLSGKYTFDEILSRLSRLEDYYEFRTQPLYNNIMVALAGKVAEVLTGQTYEDLMRDQVFSPLGMNPVFLHEVPDGHRGLATPYSLDGDEVKPVSIDYHKMVGTVAPAGSICSSAEDMASFMLYHLGNKLYNRKLNITRHNRHELVRPQFLVGAHRDPVKPYYPVSITLDSYGLGFVNGMYRGFRRLWHDGSLLGYDSEMNLLPDTGTGVFISSNGPGGLNSWRANSLISYYAMDLLLDLPPWLNISTAMTFPETWDPQPTPPPPPAVVATPSPPTLGKEEAKLYMGTYSNAAMGELEVYWDYENDNLRLGYGKLLDFKLKPKSQDIFTLIGTGKGWFLTAVDQSKMSAIFTAHGKERKQFSTEQLTEVRVPIFEPRLQPIFSRLVTTTSSPDALIKYVGTEASDDGLGGNTASCCSCCGSLTLMAIVLSGMLSKPD